MPKVMIDGVEYVEKPQPITPPKNDVGGATHFAVCPDGQILFYLIGDEAQLWLAMSKMWTSPGTVPYTLNCFGDYEA